MTTIFAAFKNYVGNRVPNTLNMLETTIISTKKMPSSKTCIRKGIPRSVWCGTKITFDERINTESIPWIKDSAEVNDSKIKSKRKYVKACDKPHWIPNLKALFAEPPKSKRKYTKKTPQERTIATLRPIIRAAINEYK